MSLAPPNVPRAAHGDQTRSSRLREGRSAAPTTELTEPRRRRAAPVALHPGDPDVISELTASTNGSGLAVVLGLVGALFSLLFRIVEARVLRWYEGPRRTRHGTS